ncbi:MAG: hypothetical protein LKK11_09580 [Acidaminococcus sp.]|nr:hypothetical protein [Acidaminococcus sp.]
MTLWPPAAALLKTGYEKMISFFHSPLSLSAARRPHPARGRKMTKAFFYEPIK